MADPVCAGGHSPFLGVLFWVHPPYDIENGVFLGVPLQFQAANLGSPWAVSVRRNAPSPFLPGKATPGRFFDVEDSIVREEKSLLQGVSGGT